MNISEHVVCQLCNNHYNDPRILPCLHSFCCTCLQREAEKLLRQKGNSSISCHTCQRSTLIPVGGVKRLPQNLHLGYEVKVAGYMSKFAKEGGVTCSFCVNRCTNPAVSFCCNCHKFLCKTGSECHNYVPQLLDHNVIELTEESASLLPSAMKPAEQYCSQPKHKNQELNFFCETCRYLICRDCIVVLHKDHSITEVSIIAEANRNEMEETQKCAQEVVLAIAAATDETKKVIKQLEDSEQEARMAIDDAFKQLMQMLEERKKAVLSELESISNSKSKVLTLQMEELMRHQNEISHCNELTSHILKTHTDHEVVALGGVVPVELKAKLKEAQSVSFLPKHRSYLKFSMQVDRFAKETLKFGEIMEMSPSASDSVCTFAPKTRLNVKHFTKVETRTSKKEKYIRGNLQVKAELRPKSGAGPAVVGDVEDHVDGTYTISFTPTVAGHHQLNVTMDGQRVHRCPFDVEVRGDYQASFKSPKQVINVAQPYCVAVHDKGDVLVGCNDERVYVFDGSKLEGQAKNAIGERERGDLFDGPVGMFVKGDFLYVADVGNHCVQVLTARGKFLNSIGERGSGQGQLNAPSDVVVDSKDRVIVADRDNNRVQVFSQDGDWLLTIDGSESGDLAYKYPCSLALDTWENIHVAAYGSSVIKVFAPNGSYLRRYGGLEGPRGIAIDEDGYSLVCDRSLSVFDPQGHKVYTAEHIHHPSGITIDSKSGSVYVVLFNSNNVLRYSLTE